MFEPLATARCKIITESSVLPRWFVRMPPPRWRGLLHLPRRDIYLTPFSLPVRGWIFQQIRKIGATIAAKSNIIVHVDSDAAFIRPLKLERLYTEARSIFFATHIGSIFHPIKDGTGPPANCWVCRPAIITAPNISSPWWSGTARWRSG